MDGGAGNDEPAAASPFVERPPANLLLLGPSMGDHGDAVSRLLETASGKPALLAVSLLRPAVETVAAWETEWRSPPSGIAAVGCKNTAGTRVDGTPGTDFRATTVADPGDLTGLGIRVGECLEAWENRPTVVAFDSMTAVLQYADTKRVFQFLHVLTSQLASAGAMSVFHMDPGAHDERTVSTVRSLFQGVYERSEGGWKRA